MGPSVNAPASYGYFWLQLQRRDQLVHASRHARPRSSTDLLNPLTSFKNWCATSFSSWCVQDLMRSSSP